jgi:hypothetical protein
MPTKACSRTIELGYAGLGAGTPKPILESCNASFALRSKTGGLVRRFENERPPCEHDRDNFKRA